MAAKKEEEKAPTRKEEALALIQAGDGLTVSELSEQVGTHNQYMRRLVKDLMDADEIEAYMGSRRAGYVYFAKGQMPDEAELKARYEVEEDDEDEDEDEGTDVEVEEEDLDEDEDEEEDEDEDLEDEDD